MRVADEENVSRGRLTITHVLVAIMAQSFVLGIAVVWVALTSTQSADIATAESRTWSMVDGTIQDISAEVTGFVASVNAAVGEDEPFALDPEATRARLEQSFSDLRARLDELAVDDDSAWSAVDRLDDTTFAMLTHTVDMNMAAGTQDDARFDRSFGRFLVEHQWFRVGLGTLVDTTNDVQTLLIEQRASEIQRRFDLVLFMIAPASVLFVSMLYALRRVKQREHELVDDLTNQQSRMQAIVDSVPLGLAWKGLDRRVIGVNKHLAQILAEHNRPDPIGLTFAEGAEGQDVDAWANVDTMEVESIERSESRAIEQQFQLDDREFVIRFNSSPLVEGNETIGVVTVSDDVTGERQMERQLAANGRMQSIGQLAAGVAHEINTPVQFVSDNTQFLEESFADLVSATDRLSEIGRAFDESEVELILDQADLTFLRKEVPGAIQQSKEGLARVSEIVRAMKNFSHPGTEIAPTDLNGLIDATVSISRNEWKYIAEMQLDLDDDLPMVECREGEIKQVVLNMVVNAAHAVAEAVDEGQLGRIGIKTGTTGDGLAEITVWDEGSGMAPEVKERIFEQFFTTKDVGKGTGQGLALAWDIVRKHGGSIDVESTPGEGTSFTITLPFVRSRNEQLAA